MTDNQTISAKQREQSSPALISDRHGSGLAALFMTARAQLAAIHK
jgi:hypothetical protein